MPAPAAPVRSAPARYAICPDCTLGALSSADVGAVAYARADGTDGRTTHPQSAEPDLRLRSTVLVSTHGGWPGPAVVVSGALVRATACVIRFGGLETRAAPRVAPTRPFPPSSGPGSGGDPEAGSTAAVADRLFASLPVAEDPWTECRRRGRCTTVQVAVSVRPPAA